MPRYYDTVLTLNVSSSATKNFLIKMDIIDLRNSLYMYKILTGLKATRCYVIWALDGIRWSKCKWTCIFIPRLVLKEISTILFNAENFSFNQFRDIYFIGALKTFAVKLVCLREKGCVGACVCRFYCSNGRSCERFSSLRPHIIYHNFLQFETLNVRSFKSSICSWRPI